MTIPKIVHQTAATAALPAWCNTLRQRAIALHPGWEHRFYDDRECRELVCREMPYLLPVYDGYEANIQRADMFRVVAVYVAGGFYLDVDIECRVPLDALCRHGCAVGEENVLGPEEAAALGHRHRQRIANYMFGAEMGHPFLVDVLDEMLHRAGRPVTTDHDVLESTGPGLITDVFHEVRDRYHDLVLVPAEGILCQRCRAVCCQFGPFAAHHHMGSWRGRHEPPPSSAAPVDQSKARRMLASDHRRPTASETCVVLATYAESERDGLTSTFAKVHGVGTLMHDTRVLAGRRVLVPGIPFLYLDRISPRNTNVLLTMFESSRLPPYWVQSINGHYDACIVPNEAVARAFADSGVGVALHVVQLGYTRYRRHREVAPSPGEVFRVGFAGVPVPRKNLDKLFLACAALVEEVPRLRLSVHVSHWYDWLDPRAWDHVRAAPFVEWSEGVRSSDEMAAWFARLACYVYPSSGEGWSFTPRESMFAGVPTVISAIPSHAELVASGYCTVVATDGTQPADFGGMTSGEWARITIGDIAHAILEVYRDRPAAEARAVAGSHWIEDKWLDADTRLGVRAVLDRT